MGAVYFICTATAVKIGFAEHVPSRMDSLQAANAERLELLGAIHGDATLERFFHRKLKAHRVNREWFEKNHAVLTFVQEALEAYPPPAKKALAKSKPRFVPQMPEKKRDGRIEAIECLSGELSGLITRIERVNDVIQRVLDARKVERDHKLEKFSLVSKEFHDGVLPPNFQDDATAIFNLTGDALKCLSAANEEIWGSSSEAVLLVAQARSLVELAEKKIAAVFGPYKLLPLESLQNETLLTRQSLSVVRELKERE